MEVGGEGGEIIYLLLHYHHQNDSCIKMGSDESHFNVSLIVRDKVIRQCPQKRACVRACVCACVCVCVRACVRACVRVPTPHPHPPPPS